MEHPPKIVEKVAPQNGFFQDFPSISPEHRHLRHRGTLQIPTVGLRKVAVGPLRQRFLRGHGDVHDDFHVGNPAINLPHPIIIGFTTLLHFFLGWTCYTFQDLPGSINGMLWVNQFDCLPLSFSLHGSSWIWSNQKSDHMISYVYDASDSMSMYVYIYIHHIYIYIYIYICAMNDGRVLPKGRFLPYPPATRIWVTDGHRRTQSLTHSRESNRTGKSPRFLQILPMIFPFEAHKLPMMFPFLNPLAWSTRLPYLHSVVHCC